MPGFENLLESFRDGALSRQALFRAVEEMLGEGLEDPAGMLDLLNGDSARSALSDDIRTAIRQRIKAAVVDGAQPFANNEAAPDSATRLVSSVFPEDPDSSRTQLAASLLLQGREPAAEQSFTRIAVSPGDPDSPGALSPGPDGPGVDAGTGKDPADEESEPVKGAGDVLNDRFVLEECLGSGGMSTVYKALDRRKLEANDRHPYVAVKVLNVEFRSHPDSLIALQREAKKSQSLAHPNIVRVYDFDRDGATVYMTMEYLAGSSLAQKIKAPNFKGVPHDQAMRILKGMARALSFAHDNGIVHADFKPANVLLTTSGEVKVIDFGIARAFQRPEDTDMEETRFDPGSLGALTPAYASPEMLEQCEPDPRDDVYGLACITYEMFTGHHPFARMQATEARDAGLEIERDEKISRRQYRALKAALAFDRPQRTATAEQFLNDIRPLRIVKPAFAAALSLLAVFAGGLGYYLVKPGTDPVVLSQQVDETEQASLEVLQLVQSGNTAVQMQVSLPEEPLATVSGSVTSGHEAISGVETVALVAGTGGAGRTTSVETPLTAAAVMPVVERFPCSALDVSVENGDVELRGFASRELDLKRLERDLAALPGAGRVASRIQLVSADKCPVIELLAPYWVANRSMGQGTSITTRGKPTGQLTEGEPLVVDITTPSYESYINVDYFFLDGGVFHLSPGPRSDISRLQANQRATLGKDGQWVVTEPYGTEMVAVLVTPEPLFELPRREYESGSEYLADVQQRLRSMADQFDQNRITADFVFVETRKKAPVIR